MVVGGWPFAEFAATNVLCHPPVKYLAEQVHTVLPGRRAVSVKQHGLRRLA
jgi:hypothetical protein